MISRILITTMTGTSYEPRFRQMRYTSSRESIWQRMLDAFGAEEGESLLDALERSTLDEVRVIAKQLRREFEAPHIDQADVPVMDVVDLLQKSNPPREAIAHTFCAGFGFNLRVNRPETKRRRVDGAASLSGGRSGDRQPSNIMCIVNRLRSRLDRSGAEDTSVTFGGS